MIREGDADKREAHGVTRATRTAEPPFAPGEGWPESSEEALRRHTSGALKLEAKTLPGRYRSRLLLFSQVDERGFQATPDWRNITESWTRSGARYSSAEWDRAAALASANALEPVTPLQVRALAHHRALRAGDVLTAAAEHALRARIGRTSLLTGGPCGGTGGGSRVSPSRPGGSRGSEWKASGPERGECRPAGLHGFATAV